MADREPLQSLSLASDLSMGALRERLLEKRSEGYLGVIAARSTVPEWVIRDWLDKPLNTPTREEITKIQNALDNRKR